jgi:hypothetical protein
MAVKISGKSVKWGIPAAGKTLADGVVAGIVQNISLNRGGNVENIPDEDGDIVTRVDHGAMNSGSFTTLVTATSPALPAKGDEITGLSAIDGVALNTGRTFVEDASITYSGVSTTEVQVSFTHYPEMGATGA